MLLAAGSLAAPLGAEETGGVPADGVAADDVPFPFDWDLVSLEQTNPRFNASVLSGFHSVRSPGVTPHRAWKTGLGLLYSRAEQVLEATNTELFDRQQLILNPKINYGLLGRFEVGAGFEGSWAEGKDIETLPGGGVQAESAEAFEASAVGVGAKWGFLRTNRVRLALAFDSRIAINHGAFGALPETLYNVEVDGDYAFTSRLSVVSNLQYMTTNQFFEEDQAVFDLAATYSFNDRFRGMLFGTLVAADDLDEVLLFSGIAGQYVFEQHSFTLAVDLQLNEAERDVRTQSQIDVEFSYTFTF